jgi:ribosomal protein S18 acetylase RimI-like enzyme
MLLARHAGREGGFVATRRNDESTADITDLIVHPSNSRQGIGTALVERAIGARGPRLLESVVVRTEVDNHRAIAFYERLGFRPSGATTEDVAGDAVELCELVMSV